MIFLLIIPPSTTGLLKLKRDEFKVEPLGALYLGTMVNDLCDFRILDCYSHSFDENSIISQIKLIDPDFVGFSINFSSFLSNGLKLAERVKNELNKKIIFGGNISTFLYNKLILKEYIDYIFLHEAERTFRIFIKKILSNDNDFSNISGFVYKHNGNVVVNPFKEYEKNLDNFPIPNHALLENIEMYKKSILTSRGCPYNCIYCSTKQMWGKKWRKRSAEHTFSEIKYLHDNFKLEKILSFVDDNFLVDIERFKKLVYLMERNKLCLPLGFSSRLEQIDENVLKICKRANIKKIYFGIESGSDRILKKLNRNYTRNDILKKVDLCISYGILPIASFMIGLPFEDFNDVKKTFSIMKKINTFLVQIHICSPFIGTDLFKMPDLYNIKIKIDFDKLDMLSMDSEPVIETKYFTKNEIYDLYLEGLGIALEKSGERWKYENLIDMKYI